MPSLRFLPPPIPPLFLKYWNVLSFDMIPTAVYCAIHPLYIYPYNYISQKLMFTDPLIVK